MVRTKIPVLYNYVVAFIFGQLNVLLKRIILIGKDLRCVLNGTINLDVCLQRCGRNFEVHLHT